MKKVLLSLAFLTSSLCVNHTRATDRDIDLFKKEWAELAQMVVHLRDDKARLVAENKKLEATIEPRSYLKGWIASRNIWAPSVGLASIAVGILAGSLINKKSSHTRF